jgi:hypoxanthine phosphoribosyltransferase
MSRQVLTWKDFDTGCSKLARWARPHNFEAVYGIPRGGLIVAVRLSHLLDIPMMTERPRGIRNILVVDDIVDGGKTMSRFASYQRAALVYNMEGNGYVDCFAIKKKAFVKFPWETSKTAKIDYRVVK